jgi:hypothetical protein
VKRDTFNQPISQPLMIPFAMVVRHESWDRPPEMALTDWHHPIEALFFDRPHKTFGVGIRVGRLERRLHDADPRVAEYAPYFPTPFPIAVTDQYTRGTPRAITRARERATDLLHEEIVGMRSRAEDLDTA